MEKLAVRLLAAGTRATALGSRVRASSMLATPVGEKYERLAQIKSEYDPGNVLAGNQNIRPKVSA